MSGGEAWRSVGSGEKRQRSKSRGIITCWRQRRHQWQAGAVARKHQLASACVSIEKKAPESSLKKENLAKIISVKASKIKLGNENGENNRRRNGISVSAETAASKAMWRHRHRENGENQSAASEENAKSLHNGMKNQSDRNGVSSAAKETAMAAKNENGAGENRRRRLSTAKIKKRHQLAKNISASAKARKHRSGGGKRRNHQAEKTRRHRGGRSESIEMAKSAGISGVIIGMLIAASIEEKMARKLRIENSSRAARRRRRAAYRRLAAAAPESLAKAAKASWQISKMKARRRS